METKNTIKDLLEYFKDDDGGGTVTDIIPPAILRELNNFAMATSGAMQPSVEDFYTHIERFLNKFSLTLGELENISTDDDESGEEDFLVFRYLTGDVVKNILLSAEYEKTQPQLYKYQPKPLHYRVKLSVHEITPAQFDEMLSTGEITLTSDDDYTGDKLTGDDDTDDMAEELSRDGTDDLKKMSDAALKRALKQARRKEDKQYDNLVSEFERRGLKESVNSIKEMMGSSEDVAEAFVLKVKDGNKWESFWYEDKKSAENFMNYLLKDGYKKNEMKLSAEKKPSSKKFAGDRLKAKAKLSEGYIEG
jgi:hypothetical protein